MCKASLVLSPILNSDGCVRHVVFGLLESRCASADAEIAQFEPRVDCRRSPVVSCLDDVSLVSSPQAEMLP